MSKNELSTKIKVKKEKIPICDKLTTKIKVKKEKIPICVKNTLWSLYFENNIQGNCLCCKIEVITRNNFDCGHIISEKNGGKIELENLKPICRSCNSSMGINNMNDFMIKYGFEKIQIKDIQILNVDNKKDELSKQFIKPVDFDKFGWK